jgi:hypothetical protein
MNTEKVNDQLMIASAKNSVLTRVRRRRHLVTAAIAGGAVVVAVSSMGAALVVQQVSSHEARTSAVCYSHDDLGSLSGTVQMADGAGNLKSDLCGDVWREGLKYAAAHGGHWPNIDPNTSTLRVPRLAYCVLDDGVTAGFPIEAPSKTKAGVCENLGLAAAHNAH